MKSFKQFCNNFAAILQFEKTDHEKKGALIIRVTTTLKITPLRAPTLQLIPSFPVSFPPIAGNPWTFLSDLRPKIRRVSFESWENNRKRLQNKNGDHKKQTTPSLPTFLNGEKNHQIGSSGTRDGGQLTQHQGDFQDLIFIWSHVTCSSKIHGKCTSTLLSLTHLGLRSS